MNRNEQNCQYDFWHVVKGKAAGGIRSLDELLAARSWGADRIGTSATRVILAEARRRGYKQEDSIRGEE